MRAHLRDQLQFLASRLKAIGLEVRPIVFDAPAKECEVAQVERELGVALPPSLRSALLEVSGHLEFQWFAPKEFSFPDPFGGNFAGGIHWSIDLLRTFEEGRRGWVLEVFPNSDDPYDVVWHNKLAFQEVGNGDLFAFDLSEQAFEQVVYLSHDDGEGHGYVLADNLSDLVERWMPLAFTGAEDWQWLPFASGSSSRLDPHSQNAIAWRSLLGLAT
jgi:hypothetical protein